MKTKSERIKSILSNIFIIVMIFGSVVFIVNWGFTDWDKLSDEFQESSTQLLNGIHCEIDYKDFHYEGLCTDRKEIFDFIKDVETYNNYTKEKDRRHYCKLGAYWLWTAQHPSADIVSLEEGVQVRFDDIDSWCSKI